jgi:hypothetical protein
MAPERQDLLWGAAATIGSSLLVVLVLRLWRAELTLPLYGEGDSLAVLGTVKSMLVGGWFLRNPELGAPFGQELYDFPLYSAQVLQYAVMKVLGLFVSGPATVVNLYFLLTFPLITLTAFAVLRWIGASPPVAATCAVLFAFVPYHFTRNEAHLGLAAYYIVPLSAYLILALYADRPLFTRRSPAGLRLRSYTTGRSLLTLAICAAVGLFDPYYFVFTALLLIAVIGVRVITGGGRRVLVTGAVVLATMSLTFMAAISPNLVYRLEHGVNEAAAFRNAPESETYSLNLVALAAPAPGHRIPALDRLQQRYRRSSAVGREPASIGIIATLGFAWLLVVALIGCLRAGRRAPAASARQRHLAAAALTAFLIGTTGGVSAILALVVSPQIRGWNRLSIFIAFFALAAVALLLDALARSLTRRRRGRLVLAAVLAAVLAFGLLDQTTEEFVPDYDRIAARHAIERTFVTQAERVLPADAMVFQLPYLPYPEYGSLNRMGDYDHLRPYLLSGDLRWSYGAMKNRPADWQATLAGASPAEIVPRVAGAGFQGLYLDRFGYPDDGRTTEAQISRVLSARPLSSFDRRMLLWDLRPYARRLRGSRSMARIRTMANLTLRPVRPEWNTDLDPWMADGTSWWWQSQSPRIRLDLRNPLGQHRDVMLSATVSRGSWLAPPMPVEVRYPDGAVETIRVGATPVPIRRRQRVPPGRSQMELVSAGPPQSGSDGGGNLQIRNLALPDRSLVHEVVAERSAAQAPERPRKGKG